MSKIQQIENLLATQPNDNFLQHALALEYIKIGDDIKATTIFENLLNNDANYVGSYYHLAKLYERNNQEQQAIATYEKGIQIALAQNEKHAYGELRSALEELTM